MIFTQQTWKWNSNDPLPPCTEFHKMFIVEFVYAISPVIAYLPQYFTITNGSSSGFSSVTCLLLLLSNILRILWYPFHHFKTTLLWQSLIMIVIQILLLSAVVKTKNPNSFLVDNSIHNSHQTYTYRINTWLHNFWSWDSINQYLYFLLVFVLGAIVFLKVPLREKLAHELHAIVGDAALILESSLSVPTIRLNHARKSTTGLSVFMIISWVFGDFAKLFYFVLSDEPQPTQFIMGAWISVFFDCVVLYQLLFVYPNDQISRSRAVLNTFFNKNLGNSFLTPMRKRKKDDGGGGGDEGEVAELLVQHTNGNSEQHQQSLEDSKNPV